MKKKFRKRLPTLLLLLSPFVLFLLILPFLFEDNYFRGVPRPPLPSHAKHVQISFGTSMMPGTLRIIYFETDQPAETVQQFFRTELLKQGWYWVCSGTPEHQPGCPIGPLSVAPDIELVDAYSRDDEPSMKRAISVWVYKPGEQRILLVDPQNRLVELNEYRYELIGQSQTLQEHLQNKEFPLTPGFYPLPGAEAPTPLPVYPYP